MKVNCPDIDAKLQLCADFTQRGFELCAWQPPQMAQHDVAVTIEYDRIGQRPARVAKFLYQAACRSLADQNRIVDRHLLQKLRDIGWVVGGRGDKFHPARLELS